VQKREERQVYFARGTNIPVLRSNEDVCRREAVDIRKSINISGMKKQMKNVGLNLRSAAN
jgi:hypothetical protein